MGPILTKNEMEPTMKKLGAEAYDKTTKAR